MTAAHVCGTCGRRCRTAAGLASHANTHPAVPDAPADLGHGLPAVPEAAGGDHVIATRTAPTAAGLIRPGDVFNVDAPIVEARPELFTPHRN